VLDTSPFEETGTMIVSGLSDCPFTGEDRRREEECFTWFLISGLEEPNFYHNLMLITMRGGFYFVRCHGRELIIQPMKI